MKLLNSLIDRLQAAFPPNRVVVILTPIAFVPAAASVSGWLAEHFPGLALPEYAVVGVMGAAALAALVLANKWLDGWQAGEPLDVEGDLEDALSQFLSDPDSRAAFMSVHPELFTGADLSPLRGIGAVIEDLRTRAEQGEFNGKPDVLGAALGELDEELRGFVAAASVAPASSTA